MRRPSSARRRFRIPTALAGLLASSAAFGVTVVVTSTADVATNCASTGQPGPRGEGCTLRDAILFSNANPQPQAFANLIQFDIQGPAPYTIGLGDLGSGVPLPAITTGTTVDGYSQPGAFPASCGICSDANILIDLQGDAAADPLLHVTGGTGTLIRGLLLNGQGSDQDPYGAPRSIVLDSPFNVVAGNWIGIGYTGNFVGLTTLGNVTVNSGDNQIGGSDPADHNLMGVETPTAGGMIVVAGSGNRIQGNQIGTNSAGFTLDRLGPVGGGIAIRVTGDDNFIGGSPAERNQIAGHSTGILFFGGGAFANVVEGNYIGTDSHGGNGADPNTDGIGLQDASGNLIGALTAGNRIAFNRDTGIQVSGSSQGNTICCNSIFANGSNLGNGNLGIDLIDQGVPGVTFNDACDGDGGPNGLQNFPSLTGAATIRSTTHIQGTLNSTPSTSFRIQFFANTQCDPSGFGQGETFVAETFLATDANCNLSFSVPVFPAIPGGQFVTATATALSTGDTSEFSACQPVLVPQHQQINGAVQSLDPAARTLGLSTASGVLTIRTDEDTKFRKSHRNVDFEALAVGDTAEVKESPLGDGSFLADKVTVPQ